MRWVKDTGFAQELSQTASGLIFYHKMSLFFCSSIKPITTGTMLPQLVCNLFDNLTKTKNRVFLLSKTYIPCNLGFDLLKEKVWKQSKCIFWNPGKSSKRRKQCNCTLLAQQQYVVELEKGNADIWIMLKVMLNAAAAACSFSWRKRATPASELC